MKVCKRCGVEIASLDGDNYCHSCKDTKTNKVIGVNRQRVKANRLARESALESCGLVKVRGALGGTYWE